MKRTILIFGFVFYSALMSIRCVNASAGDAVSSAVLIDQALSVDGKVVVYRGEAIYGIMKRGSYAWLNVHDGTNAIGVWCRAELLENITTFGDYKHSGDIVEITGTFHQGCSEHGGDLDIHAVNVALITPGYPIPEGPAVKRLYSAIIIFCAAFILMFVFREKQNKERA